MTTPAGPTTPALLRLAGQAYARAIRDRLEASGFTDLPRQGTQLLLGIAAGRPAKRLVRELGLVGAAAERPVGLLVAGGYLDLEHCLTDRGKQATSEISRAVDEVDARLTAAERDGLRAGLEALARIRDTYEARATG